MARKRMTVREYADQIRQGLGARPAPAAPPPAESETEQEINQKFRALADSFHALTEKSVRQAPVRRDERRSYGKTG